MTTCMRTTYRYLIATSFKIHLDLISADTRRWSYIITRVMGCEHATLVKNGSQRQQRAHLHAQYSICASSCILVSGAGGVQCPIYAVTSTQCLSVQKTKYFIGSIWDQEYYILVCKSVSWLGNAADRKKSSWYLCALHCYNQKESCDCSIPCLQVPERKVVNSHTWSSTL